MPVRKIIRIDEAKCTGCGNCVTACPEGAMAIINGKAKVIRESFCDGLGACIGECPEGALTIEEREAEEFDEEAVKQHLTKKHKRETPICSCPSSAPMSFERRPQEDTHEIEQKAHLAHWPIQLALIPPTAPFLKGKDLVILADCTAVAYGDIQNKFVKGNAVMICCPKLDDTEPYERKLKEIVRTAGIRSITVVHMEVPCCFGLHGLVAKILTETRSDIPYRQFVIGIKGDIKD
jgi:ferredoxin